MKKVRGENEIEVALQRLDRLTQDEVRATAAQTLQVVNTVEREPFPVCNVLRRPGALSLILQGTAWCGTSGNGSLLRIPGKITTLFMIVGIAKPEHG